MSSPSVKELIGELNKHGVDASKLRNTLNELDGEKEAWFKKKDEDSKKIRDFIQKIKGNKTKRDALTNEIKDLKPKRDSLNIEINEKLKQFDKLKKEKIELEKSLDIKESPSSIRNHFEKLEFKIETEPMPFNKEQSVMKKIKELKRLYDDALIVDEANKKLKSASEEIRKIRKDANETHKLIQEKAKQSQTLHEEIIKISGEIDKIKVDEDAAFKKFSELKKKFNDANSELKGKLRIMNDIKEQLDKISADKKERKRIQEESFLKSKEDEVNAKIKRGEKLTTEDLLVFQKFER